MNSQKDQPDTAIHPQFEVFFDGDCPLCRREIEMIRRWDRTHQLILTDISSPTFVPQDRDMTTLMREIHGRTAAGEYVTGVDVFREIYGRLGLKRTVGCSRLFGVRHLLDLGYRVFAYFRFRLALRRQRRSLPDCATCQVPAAAAGNESLQSGLGSQPTKPEKVAAVRPDTAGISPVTGWRG